MAHRVHLKVSSSILALLLLVCILPALTTTASAGVVATYDWESLSTSDNGNTVTETHSVSGTDVTVTVSAIDTNSGNAVIAMDLFSGSYGGVTSGIFLASESNYANKITFSFSSAVDIISIYCGETGCDASISTFTPTGGTNSTVIAPSLNIGYGQVVDLNWTGVTSFTVTSNNYGSWCVFDDLVLGTASDDIAPTLSSATRVSNTEITVELSEACQNLAKSNDGGFTVTKTGDPATTYSVASTAQGADTSHVKLTMTDNIGTAAAAGVTVTYTAGTNGTIADLAGNALASDSTGVAVTAWDTTAPTVTSINRGTPTDAATSATNVSYHVTFSESVTGVDASDFTLTATDSAAGTIDTVTGSGAEYNVSVISVSGPGTLRLDLKSSGTGIADAGGTAISTGFTSGQTYTIDQTAPTVSSIQRNTPSDSTTKATSVIYRITFSESVSSVDTSDFTLTATGSAAGTISTVSGSSGTTIDITVSSVTGTGTLRLDLKSSGTGIADAAGNALSGGYTSGETYTIDNTAPSVSSIVRYNPTSASINTASCVYRVTFSESVTGVGTDDFTLTKTDTANGTISAISGSGGTYDITVSSLSGTGTLRLDFNSTGTGVVDSVSNAVSGGYSSGETYTIDRTVPTVSSINRGTPTDAATNATSVTYHVTFSESVTGVDASDFTLTATDSAAGTIGTVTGSGAEYNVSVISVSGPGTLRLDLKSSGTGIADAGGNAIATGFTTGQTYTIDQSTPTVSSINRKTPAGAATNAGSVVYHVTFSEAVTGVDTADFTLTKTGSASGAVSLVTATSTSEYDVTVNTVTGDGTLRLDLNSSATGITDTAGNTVSGFTTGQTYTIDNTAPTLSSAARNSDTQIIVTLSEACQNLSNPSGSGGFTVTKSGTSTTYAVSATAQGTDANHVVLTVANMGAAASAGVVVTYTAGSITDAAANAMATDSTGKTIAAWDTTAPAVQSINRYNPTAESTIASSVVYRVTFSEAVTGVDITDFSLTKTGTADGTIASVSASSGTVIDVTVSTLSGTGTLRLNLNGSGTGIADTGGTAIAAGYTAGQLYSIDNTIPTLSGAVRNTTTQITVTLSEACQNLANSNNGGFTVTKTGTAIPYLVTQTAQGTDATQIVLTVADTSTAGSVGVTITYTAGGSGVIADTAGNAMVTDSTGLTIAAWDTTAPVITGATIDSNTQITLHVSERLLNVDKPNDGGFTVTKTGTDITYQVFSTAQGSIILTVADLSSASTTGVTVTYTAGGNGTITDLAGNPMASTTSSSPTAELAAWQIPPQTGDSAHPALYLILLIASGVLLISALVWFWLRKKRSRN